LADHLYQVRVTTKQGLRKVFNVSENEYIASHSEILWDNKDFVFVKYGCGIVCWGGKLLSLKDNRKITNYLTYMFADSVNNIIVYPDSSSWDSLIIENFKSGKKKGELMDYCERANGPFNAIDKIIYKGKNRVSVSYSTTGCKTIKTKTIILE